MEIIGILLVIYLAIILGNIVEKKRDYDIAEVIVLVLFKAIFFPVMIISKVCLKIWDFGIHIFD